MQHPSDEKFDYPTKVLLIWCTIDFLYINVFLRQKLEESEHVHERRASWGLPSIQKPHLVRKTPMYHKILQDCIYRNCQQKLPLFSQSSSFGHFQWQISAFIHVASPRILWYFSEKRKPCFLPSPPEPYSSFAFSGPESGWTAVLTSEPVCSFAAVEFKWVSQPASTYPQPFCHVPNN